MAKVLGIDPLWLMGFDVPMKKEIRDELTRFKTNTYEVLVVKEMQKLNKSG